MTLKAPFPWFGGKSRVADQVWAALGDVRNYVEPFAGSLATLLMRPPDHEGGAETVNDRDRYLANFWRAVQADPDAVAHAADWPVNECDLTARHVWLVSEGRRALERMDADPEFFDAKIAGWWVWGQCAWIGSGWCAGTGPWTVEDGQLVRGDAGRGINRQLPHLGDAGRGINRQLPHLGNAGRGINRQLPHLGNAGQGINRKLPHLGNAGQGIAAYMQQLADRLRRVRVCCGDWSRVVTDGAMKHGATVGVFLDPPYLGSVRTTDLYASDDHDVANDVREWALAHGNDPRMRIVLAGYEGEHDMPATWRVVGYSGKKAYGSHAGGGVNADNRHKERLWFSPHCLVPVAAAERQQVLA